MFPSVWRKAGLGVASTACRNRKTWAPDSVLQEQCCQPPSGTFPACKTVHCCPVPVALVLGGSAPGKGCELLGGRAGRSSLLLTREQQLRAFQGKVSVRLGQAGLRAERPSARAHFLPLPATNTNRVLRTQDGSKKAETTRLLPGPGRKP